MRWRLFIGQFFRALFVSWAWYWKGLWILSCIGLAGLPGWASQFPAIARMTQALGFPYWAYGVLGSIIIACYFAWTIADLTTPKVVFLKTKFATNSRARISIANVSTVRCEKLMCALTAVYYGCTDVHPENEQTYFTEYATDFPLVLTTQSRLRRYQATGEPIPRERWSLDPGQTKNIEVMSLVDGGAEIIHESGRETVPLEAVTTFCLRITGDTAPMDGYIVVFKHTAEGHSTYTCIMQARDKFELQFLQQFCVEDLIMKDI
jgi:hypothetical protein